MTAIARDTKSFETFSVFKDAESLSNKLDQVTEASLESFTPTAAQLANGKISWKQDQVTVRYRQFYQELFQNHIRTLLSNLSLPEKPNIVELGAGFLIDGKHSYLSSFLPQSMQDGIVLTDLNLKAVEAAKKSLPKDKYLQLGGPDISKSFSNLDMLVSCCFLDTLSVEELEKTLDQAYKALKPGGIYLEISDLQPYLTRVILELKDQSGIMFPICKDRDFIGLQFVSKEACELLLEGKESGFLRKYIEASNDTRALFLQLISDEELIELAKFVEVNFRDKRTQVLSEDYFSQKIKSALDKTELKVLKCGLELQTAYTTKTKADRHKSYTARWGIVSEKGDALLESVVEKNLYVHVLLAKKEELPLKIAENASCCVIL